MSSGLAIHIALNYVDATAYGGWNGQLAGCLHDAEAMQQISTSLGYSATTILNNDATAARVLQAIADAAAQLGPSGILLLTYSGHGARVPFVDADHPDGQDDTWVLYDRMLLGHELYLHWSAFPAGARVFVLSDSCHSGTVLRDPAYSRPGIGDRHKEIPLPVLAAMGVAAPQREAPKATSQSGPAVFRVMPPEVLRAHLVQRGQFYRSLAASMPRDVSGTIDATILLISGCQDNQTSQDGTNNGLFTQRLLEVWDNGSFTGDYPTFKQQIVQRMPPEQTPNYFIVGINNPGFEAQKPFTLAAPSSQAPTAQPEVVGPAHIAQFDPSPRFDVTTGANRYYEFEITSQPRLFDWTNHHTEQTPANFWASWSTAARHLSGPSFTLPDSAWQALNGSSRLYYRIVTSSNETTWANVIESTSIAHAAEAPSMEISDTPADKGAPMPGLVKTLVDGSYAGRR